MIYLCIGRRGQGKTTLALYLARKAKKRIVFDPRGLVRSGGLVLQTSLTTAVQQGIDQVVDGEESELVITPTMNVQPVFDAVARELHEWLRVDPLACFTLLIDEIRFIRNLDTPEFEWLLRCSNPERVNIVMTCHRPADVPTDIRAIADRWLVFRVTQEHDLRVIESRSPKVAQIARTLGAREFVEWDDAAGEWQKHLRAEKWYVPLGGGTSALDNPDVSLGLIPEKKIDDVKLF